MNRDFASEMRRLIDTKTSTTEYTIAVVADEIVEELKDDDPALLNGWLRLNARQVLRNHINQIERIKRSHTLRNAKRDKFYQAAMKAEGGDDTEIREFLEISYVVDTSHTRKKLKDLTSKELLFVAEDYQTRAKYSKLHEYFLRELANKVGDDLVSDHYTDEELSAIWDSMNV